MSHNGSQGLHKEDGLKGGGTGGWNEYLVNILQRTQLKPKIKMQWSYLNLQTSPSQ